MECGSTSDGNNAVWDTVNGEKYYNNYKKMAETTNFKLTLYICESIDGYQNMIVFFTQGRYEKPAENINVKVTKKWNDNNNAYEMRKDSIKVTLKADGKTQQTATLSDSNSWTHTFKNLPKLNAKKNKITYTVEEEAITGYEYNVEESKEYNLIITNTIQKKTVSVNKIWKDGNNSSGLRPSSITVKLIADGVDTGKTIILNESNKWKGKFSNLDKYKQGEEIKYTIKEVEEIEGYKTEVNGFTITNTLEYETSVVNIKKIWNDNNNNDGLRPELVKVTIKSKELDKSDIVELSEQNNWSYTWSDTHGYVDGRVATFSVTEEEVPGYTAEIKQTQTNQFTITNSHTPDKREIKVTKVWEDENNIEGKRTNSVTAKLLEEGKDTGKKITLSTNNNWTGKFTDLPKYKNGKQINYTIQEIEEIEGYSSTISGNMATGYIITNILKNGAIVTNKHEPQRVDVTVTKEWNDKNDFDELRPDSVTVTLLAGGEPVRENANGVSITSTVTLSEKNNWTYTFTELFKYRHEGIPIIYSIHENAIYPDTNERGEYPYNHPYNNPISNSVPSTNTERAYDYTDYKITVTNTHVPHYDGYYEITGTVWNDGAPGKGSIPNAIYGTEDKPLSGIKVKLKDKDGNPIASTYTDIDGNFTRTDCAETDRNGDYTIRVNYVNRKDSNNVYQLYRNASEVEKQLREGAYVEFEYDGLKYTTVASEITGNNTSKANENENDINKANKTDSHARNQLDSDYSTITNGPPTRIYNELGWTDKNIIAETKPIFTYGSNEINPPRKEIIKYCSGNGNYSRTQYDNTTKVQKGKHTCSNCNGILKEFEVKVIQFSGINLGLFEREQPNVALFSDIEKVEIVMNGQKYTYIYGLRTVNVENKDGILVKFQNPDTYTYRRPVNPADVAYLKDGNDNAMNVYVTYGISVGNLSSTLTLTVDNLVNYYDSNYEIQYGDETNPTTRYHITYGSMNKNTGEISGAALNATQIPKDPNSEYNEATLTGLGITVANQNQSDKIYIRYKINQASLSTLFDNTPPLNNATEILSYETRYGAKTIYAGYKPNSQQGIGGRTNDLYGGYDENSHPGNAEIYINDDKRLAATNLEDDTDIAPAFVLCRDNGKSKTLSGNVWEDGNIKDNGERLGNGYKDSTEKNVENVKVELYNLDGTIATRYRDDINVNKIESGQEGYDIYTNGDGYYTIPGVVTGEYYVKYTYGNEDENKITTIKEGIKVNARDYKSTIITEENVKKLMIEKVYSNFNDEEKKWHITHEDEYSVAVDNMYDRLQIEDLKYGNYETGENMTAYTMPFKTQVEFKANGISNSDQNGVIDVSNEWSRLDFGIIERPHENLLVQKTITNFKITLANGQVLTEGNPSEEDANIPYTKPIGFKEYDTVQEIEKTNLDKRLLIEIDTEIIQGAKLDVEYEVKVINNNEIDYDYGEITDYEAEYNGNVYISKNPKAKYYYYGGAEELRLTEDDMIKATIGFVDYINDDLVYDEDFNKDNWSSLKAEEVEKLKTDEYISEKALEAIKKNGYRVLRTKENLGVITLAREDKSDPIYMKASRLLANKDENVYDNNAEIISIDAKTARTVKDIIDNKQLEYTPGNYEPSLHPDEEDDETDDDRVEIIITPPTGVKTNTIQYVIIGLIGLITAFAVIIFIKKKVLIK